LESKREEKLGRDGRRPSEKAMLLMMMMMTMMMWLMMGVTLSDRRGARSKAKKKERRKKTKKTPNDSAHSLSPFLHPHNYLFSSTSSISSIPLDLP
jgi:biopolymer transport protein ExbB/TolQ